MFRIIMETCIDPNFGTTNLSFKVKQEPREDDEYSLYPSENFVTKSLVLKFVKDRHGEYSVIPRIKPDPFYEEFLEDVKLEEENDLNPDLNNDFAANPVICKEEFVHHEPIKNESETSLINMIRCSKCLYTNTEYLVKRHNQRVHVLVTKYSCPFCNKENFKEPLALDSHILSNHTDIHGALDLIKRTIFKCFLCHYKSLKRNNFRRHLITHDESELKKCLNGDNEGLAKDLAAIDARKGIPTNKFDCLHCSYSTKERSSIIVHVRLHNEVTALPFSCKGCKRKFNAKKSLDSHIVKRHGKKLFKLITSTIYKCDFCNFKDAKKSNVLRHTRLRHKQKGTKKKLASRKSKLK